jgi:hypothetical protein
MDGDEGIYSINTTEFSERVEFEEGECIQRRVEMRGDRRRGRRCGVRGGRVHVGVRMKKLEGREGCTLELCCYGRRECFVKE